MGLAGVKFGNNTCFGVSCIMRVLVYENDHEYDERKTSQSA